MIVVAFAVMGVLLLFSVYLVLRMQNLQRELALTRTSAKQSNSKVSHAYRNLVLVTEALEKNLSTRTENAFKRRLINAQQHAAFMVLMSNFSTIVMACCEKGASLEEALNQVLKNEELSLTDLQEVLKEMPSNVRMAWSKNSADGFIAACQLITITISGTTKSAAQKEHQAS